MQGRKILFGVTGSIAAFKAAGWVSSLVKEEARVTVMMTESATRFVTPLTFGALSGNRVYTDMFSTEAEEMMAHITLSGDADAVLIAPATAQTLARLAHGMADNLLAAAVLGRFCTGSYLPCNEFSNACASCYAKKSLYLKKVGLYHRGTGMRSVGLRGRRLRSLDGMGHGSRDLAGAFC